MKLQEDLREFIELLNSHGVDFLVVGGHAVAYHGHPRYTAHIDFLVRASQENAARIVEVLEAFGFKNAADIKPALAQSEKIVQLGRPPNRIDILTSASGISFEEAWKRSIYGELDGIPVRFPDIDSLLKNKRASGRAKDLADVEELEKATKHEKHGPRSEG